MTMHHSTTAMTIVWTLLLAVRAALAPMHVSTLFLAAQAALVHTHMAIEKTLTTPRRIPGDTADVTATYHPAPAGIVLHGTPEVLLAAAARVLDTAHPSARDDSRSLRSAPHGAHLRMWSSVHRILNHPVGFEDQAGGPLSGPVSRTLFAYSHVH